jgi:hypothetical protein
MITDDFPFLLPRHIKPDLAAKLRILADDLERMAAGTSPTEADLANAPVVFAWRTALSPVGLRLFGRVTGHPKLGDSNAMTSQLWAACGDGTWVRTLSRFYRLGEPYRDDGPDGGACDFESGV